MSKHDIGNTPLKKLSGAKFDHFKAYIKDESVNPYGTIKDRRNKFVAEEALRLGVDKLAMITAGNNGYSLAKITGDKIKVTTIIDKTLSEDIKKQLNETAYQVIEVNLQHKILRPEELITIVREKDDEVIWDVTNGYEESYISIVGELRDCNPDYIVVPIGSGGVYVGIIEGLNRYRLPTKVIGIGTQNTTSSFAGKLHTPWTPYTKIMTKFDAIGHKIYRLTEAEIKATWQQYQHVAKTEPSSAIIFDIMNKYKFKSDDTVVFLNTGRSIST